MKRTFRVGLAIFVDGAGALLGVPALSFQRTLDTL